MKEKNTKSFVSKHKSKIIIGAGIVVCVAGTVLGIKYYNSIQQKETSFILNSVSNNIDQFSKEMITDTSKLLKTTNVREHTRNLPSGQNASPKKIALAIEKGIELKENQTLVNAHSRICA